MEINLGPGSALGEKGLISQQRGGGGWGVGRNSATEFSWVHSLGKEICQTGIYKGACPFSQTSNRKGGPNKLGPILTSKFSWKSCFNTRGVRLGKHWGRDGARLWPLDWVQTALFFTNSHGRIGQYYWLPPDACTFQCLASVLLLPAIRRFFFFRFLLLLLSGIVGRGHGLRLVCCLLISLPIISLSWTTNILNFHWWSVPQIWWP